MLYGIEFIQKLLSSPLFDSRPGLHENLFMSIGDHSGDEWVIKKIEAMCFMERGVL